MSDHTNDDDWLRVVYGLSDLEHHVRQRRPPEVSVRQTPSELDPLHAPAGEQWVRVTLVPSEPHLDWSLYLHELGAGTDEPAVMRVWWRVEPGRWQALGEDRQCVAMGRGRARLDVALRVEPDPVAGARPPRLHFEAEAW